MKNEEHLPSGQEKFYFGVDDVTEFYGTKDNLVRLWHNYDRVAHAIEFQPGTVDSNGNRVTWTTITPIEYADGTKPTEYDYRNFSRKFYKSPIEALINAVYSDSNLTMNPKIRKNFFENLQFDPETNCFIFYEYETINSMLPPKPVHMERFNNGVYELYVYKHEIQVLSSNVEKLDLAEIKANAL